MTRHKSSEPACRVCGCTEYAACDEGCSWVKVEKGSPPLCSACDGKPGDMAEALKRVDRLLRNFSYSVDAQLTIGCIRAILLAAAKRLRVRLAQEAINPDPAWGSR